MEHLKEQVNKVEKVNKLFHHLKGNIWSLEKTFDPIRCIGDKENSFCFFYPYFVCMHCILGTFPIILSMQCQHTMLMGKKQNNTILNPQCKLNIYLIVAVPAAKT